MPTRAKNSGSTLSSSGVAIQGCAGERGLTEPLGFVALDKNKTAAESPPVAVFFRPDLR